ncbi:hypothetical protein BJV77DRAFT_104558, partial [Russula vinacea]
IRPSTDLSLDTLSQESTPRDSTPTHTGPIACPCGEPIQTIEHVLLHCPRHSDARQNFLTAHGRPRTLPQLFDKPEHVLETLRFLEETGACAKPRERWEPG